MMLAERLIFGSDTIERKTVGTREKKEAVVDGSLVSSFWPTDLPVFKKEVMYMVLSQQK